MYQSEYCMVDFIENERVVFLTWKKFCCGDNYRNPVKYALGLLEEKSSSDFVIDARNGFEDDKEDVKWGFTEFIPAMADTDCKNVIFILNEVNDIQDEMDMWTKEFMKYFQVSKVKTYEEAKALLNSKKNKIFINVLYTLKQGFRSEFYKKVKDMDVIRDSRNEEGCLKYEYFFEVEDEDRILLVEEWLNQEEQEKHLKTIHYKKLQALKSEYVVDVKIDKFYC